MTPCSQTKRMQEGGRRRKRGKSRDSTKHIWILGGGFQEPLGNLLQEEKRGWGLGKK